MKSEPLNYECVLISGRMETAFDFHGPGAALARAHVVPLPERRDSRPHGKVPSEGREALAGNEKGRTRKHCGDV